MQNDRNFNGGTKLSRAKIATHLSNEIGFSKSDSLEMVEVVLSSILESVSNGESVKIPHFGTFFARVKAVRSCNSIRDQKKTIIEEHAVASFKASAALRKSMNS